jgi:hypothetical protein
VPTPPGNEADAEALAALQAVRLDSFNAEPPTTAPFYSSKLTWAVTVPDPLLVSILLDGNVVSHGGEMWVSPPAARSYHLTAKAGNHSRILRTVTVHVDFEHCAVLSTGLLHEYLVPNIEDRIRADTSGVHLRVDQIWHIPPVSVWISPGRINIALRLWKRVP